MSSDKKSTVKNRNSGKKSRKPKAKATIASIIVILMTVSLVITFLESPNSFFNDISMTLLSLIPSIISFYLFSNHNKKEEEIETNSAYENLRNSIVKSEASPTNSIGGENENSKDILELMLANMKEIRDYYVLSKNQAKNSFFLAVIMCVAGFILIGVSISTIFFKDGNFAETLIPAIGGVIVEFIAGTSLLIYRNTLDQLNRYYSSLHDNERFLSTVNIVSKISEEKQDEMYIEIIKNNLSNNNRNIGSKAVSSV